jgi:hypothetical protein
MPSQLKLAVEVHPDGYVAYPLGLGPGAILRPRRFLRGGARGRALCHCLPPVEIFGRDSLGPAEDGPVLEAFVAEAAVPG